jgi:hypothetical protein
MRWRFGVVTKNPLAFETSGFKWMLRRIASYSVHPFRTAVLNVLIHGDGSGLEVQVIGRLKTRRNENGCGS